MKKEDIVRVEIYLERTEDKPEEIMGVERIENVIVYDENEDEEKKKNCHTMGLNFQTESELLNMLPKNWEFLLIFVRFIKNIKV